MRACVSAFVCVGSRACLWHCLNQSLNILVSNKVSLSKKKTAVMTWKREWYYRMQVHEMYVCEYVFMDVCRPTYAIYFNACNEL
jgi:hypothetical protein